MAARTGGRLRLHRDPGPAHRHRRGQGRHGKAGPHGPPDHRRCRLRQDRDRGAGRLQGRPRRQTGRGAGAHHAAGRPASADVRRANVRIPGDHQGSVAVHRRRRVPRRDRRPGRRVGGHCDRHAPAVADRGAVETAGPGGGRRGAAVRRRAQGAHQGPAHPRGRADHVRHTDPAYLGNGDLRYPRDVNHPDAARGATPGPDLRRTARRQADRRGAAPGAAARRAGVLRAQPGQLDRRGRRPGA